MPISDNLASWIRPHAKLRGAVIPTEFRKQFDKSRRNAGFGRPGTETKEEKKAGVKLIEWAEDVMRHSYGSYRLAQCQDVARVSLEMGNTPQIVFSHYRELVKPKETERYWKIAPASIKGKVVRFTAAKA